MQVLFDLQQRFEDLSSISIEDIAEYIVPIGDMPPTLTIRVVDDVSTILVTDRKEQVSGLGILLGTMPILRAGDRITVTGRVPSDSPIGSWGVALISEETETRKAEECQLVQSTSPKSLFSLSYILSKADLNRLVMVQTTRWGAINPLMDINIDNILILRDEASVEEDQRVLIYSFDTDDNLLPGGAITEFDSDYENDVFSYCLSKSGNPDIKIFMNEDKKAIYVNERVKDWDGVDIVMESLGLVLGNEYHVVVTGKIDGYAPEGAIITLQGIPGFSWRNNMNMISDQDFTLSHTLSHAEIDQWTNIRITTNAAGATVPFYIYDIEIKRVGLL